MILRRTYLAGSAYHQSLLCQKACDSRTSCSMSDRWRFVEQRIVCLPLPSDSENDVGEGFTPVPVANKEADGGEGITEVSATNNDREVDEGSTEGHCTDSSKSIDIKYPAFASLTQVAVACIMHGSPQVSVLGDEPDAEGFHLPLKHPVGGD
jgi:hypothetical protein